MELKHDIFGLLAEFETPEALIHAAEHVRDAGYKVADAYAPFPVHGLTEAMGFPKTKVPLICLTCGIIGGLSGFLMQAIAQAGPAWWGYPVIIAGRPLFAWPSYIPISYECTIFCAAYSAGLGMLALNGLPKPYHPLFNVPSFQLASRSRFFICIEAKDKKFNLE